MAFGVALAGFLDGILLHSILQWHHMISNVIPPMDMHGMSVNMLADGLFDAFCWFVTIAAVALLYREGRRGRLPEPRAYLGWILFGAGVFNFVEGIVDHEILRIHHVRPTPSWLAWDIGFLAIAGVLFIVVGWILARQPRAPATVTTIRAA
jgi:uncharacterized membrane protein